MKKYAHLIERHSTDDPFKFTLKFNEPDVADLSFKQIEALIKNEIQLKRATKIEPKYLSSVPSAANKWWLCDNQTVFKQLSECMCKRGYREKLLFKSLAKLSEDNYANALDQADSSLAAPSNRFVNNPGNARMFDKQTSLFKDFIQTQQGLSEYFGEAQSQPTRIGEINRSEVFQKLNKSSQIGYKEQCKALKQVYSLEDKVFNANLQLNSSLVHLNQVLMEECESAEAALNEPFQMAKTRLLELEKSIERRYLKYPFAARKKLTSVQLSSEAAQSYASESSKEVNAGASISEKLMDLIGKKTSKMQGSDLIPRELERWRRQVRNSGTPSQLSIYVAELIKSIAWDKSIMKVICQICNCDDNEDQLLLCMYFYFLKLGLVYF